MDEFSFAASTDGTRTGEVRGVNGKCLDASGGPRDDGTQVHLWTCHTGPNQERSLP